MARGLYKTWAKKCGERKTTTSVQARDYYVDNDNEHPIQMRKRQGV